MSDTDSQDHIAYRVTANGHVVGLGWLAEPVEVDPRYKLIQSFETGVVRE